MTNIQEIVDLYRKNPDLLRDFGKECLKAADYSRVAVIREMGEMVPPYEPTTTIDVVDTLECFENMRLYCKKLKTYRPPEELASFSVLEVDEQDYNAVFNDMMTAMRSANPTIIDAVANLRMLVKLAGGSET